MTDGTAPLIVAFVFDTDGVVTRTATVHAAAWKDLFDDFLRTRAAATGTPFVPFTDEDYRRYVDGRSRYDGVAGFLESRGILLPRGNSDDPPGRDTICALGNRKNDAFVAGVREHGVEAFASTLAFVRSLHERGIRTAVVSASENCAAILESAGADELFEVRVDGLDAAALGLAGKPDPALFLEAARRLGVAPAVTAVVEDAIAGVQAARRGGFGLVVGVDRAGDPEELAANGADVVVADLAQLELDAHGRWRSSRRSITDLPSALGNTELRLRLTRRPPVVFCDYDGTLTPIVARPELATLPDETLRVLDRLAGVCVVGIISGRDLPDVRAMVPTDRVWFAGSHGFDIVGPGGESNELPAARSHADALVAVADALDELVDAIPGAWVERKRFAIAIHYRQVDDTLVPLVEAAVDRVLGASDGLRKTGGKRIFELRPDVEWDKGRALWWLLDRIEPAVRDGALPVYLGDDETDEDAFTALAGRGIGIVVGTEDRPTAAEFRLDDPDEVRAFLSELADFVEAAAR